MQLRRPGSGSVHTAGSAWRTSPGSHAKFRNRVVRLSREFHSGGQRVSLHRSRTLTTSHAQKPLGPTGQSGRSLASKEFRMHQSTWIQLQLPHRSAGDPTVETDSDRILSSPCRSDASARFGTAPPHCPDPPPSNITWRRPLAQRMNLPQRHLRRELARLRLHDEFAHRIAMRHPRNHRHQPKTPDHFHPGTHASSLKIARPDFPAPAKPARILHPCVRGAPG